MARKVVEDIEVELVRVSDDELGREACELLARLGRIKLVYRAMKARRPISDERLRKLLRRYCFDLYKAAVHAPRRKRIAVDNDDDCLL